MREHYRSETTGNDPLLVILYSFNCGVVVIEVRERRKYLNGSEG